MAYLPEIPKYGFGTAFELEPSYDPNEDDSPPCTEVTSTTTNTTTTVTTAIISNNPTDGDGKRNSEATSSSSNQEQQDCDKDEIKENEHNLDDDEDHTDKKLTPRQFKRLIRDAIKAGCRHFDCSPLYRTQPLVGQVLNEFTKTSIVPRQNFFITSKLPPNMMSVENIERSIKKSIAELQVNYLDLFLIHAPFATKHNNKDSDFFPVDPETGDTLLDEQERVLEKAWLKLVDLKNKGLTRFIGISNVNMEQVNRLNSLHHIDVVQNEYHMYNQNRDLFDHCEEIDVHFEAYAAFGSPERAVAKGSPCVSSDPLVMRIARRHRLTISQVLIQWIHEQPLSYIIKSNNIRQLEENLRATKSVSLSVNEMIDLDTLNKNVRLYPFDEHQGLTKHREYPFAS